MNLMEKNDLVWMWAKTMTRVGVVLLLRLFPPWCCSVKLWPILHPTASLSCPLKLLYWPGWIKRREMGRKTQTHTVDVIWMSGCWEKIEIQTKRPISITFTENSICSHNRPKKSERKWTTLCMPIYFFICPSIHIIDSRLFTTPLVMHTFVGGFNQNEWRH